MTTYTADNILTTDMRFDLPKLKCNRCGHEWVPRTENVPKTCAKCRSPYFLRPRVRQKKAS